MLPPSEQWWERWTRDERILGGSDFVAAVIEQTHPRPAKVAAAVVMPFLLRAVAARCQVTPEEIASSSLRRRALATRAVVRQLAVRRRGLSLRAIAGALGISKQRVARAVERGAALDIGIPSGRSPPPGFGIMTRRTGAGRYVLVRSSSRSATSHSSRPCPSMSSKLCPSTPGAPPAARARR